MQRIIITEVDNTKIVRGKCMTDMERRFPEPYILYEEGYLLLAEIERTGPVQREGVHRDLCRYILCELREIIIIQVRALLSRADVFLPSLLQRLQGTGDREISA